MTNYDIPQKTSSLYNVQPTSHTSQTRFFPSLPYTPENLKFINKFNFQFSDLTDTEYNTLCIYYLKIKHAMQDIEMMLTKLQLLFVLDSNRMLNLLHNVLLTYQFITETN